MGKRFVASQDASRDEGDEKIATMSPKMTLLVKYWEKLVENPLLWGKKTSPGNENEMRDVERSCRSVRRRVHELYTTSEKKRQEVLTRQDTSDLIGAARKVEEIVCQFERSASAKEAPCVACRCDVCSDRETNNG